MNNDIRMNWQLHSGALTTKQCNEIIDISETYPLQKGTTFSNAENHRSCDVRWVEDQTVGSILWEYIQEANKVFNVDVEPYADIQYTEYRHEVLGKYDDHHDVNWERADGRDRKLSIVIQLSDHDDYEGGYFKFKEVQTPLIKDFLVKGSVLVFPSYLVHSVSPVTKGVRKSLVAWFEGPNWR